MAALVQGSIGGNNIAQFKPNARFEACPERLRMIFAYILDKVLSAAVSGDLGLLSYTF